MEPPDSGRRQRVQRPGSDTADADDDDFCRAEPVLQLSRRGREVVEGRDELFEQKALTGVPRIAGPALPPAEEALSSKEFEAVVDGARVVVGRCGECSPEFGDRTRAIDKRNQFDDGVGRTELFDAKIAQGDELKEVVVPKDENAVSEARGTLNCFHEICRFSSMSQIAARATSGSTLLALRAGPIDAIVRNAKVTAASNRNAPGSDET